MEKLKLTSLLPFLAFGCGGQLDSGSPDTSDRALACSAAAESGAGALPSIAHPTAPSAHAAPPIDAVATQPRATYLPVAPDPGRQRTLNGAPTVIYLNQTGATLKGGYDNAATNTSSVVAGQGLSQATIPAAGFSPSAWSSLVACVKDEFSRFNVQIVDQRPQQAGYFMAMFGGNGGELNLQQGVGGIAPIDPNGCQTIDGAVVYIFSQLYGGDTQTNCEVAAQEISHAFSLDHEYLASDPMTYLQYNGHKTFQDQDASCGEFQKRACICNRPSQNSVQVLLSKLGPAGQMPMPGNDITPPTVSITSPASGAQLPAGSLAITLHATDDVGVAKATLVYQDANGSFTSDCGDNQVPCTAAGADYTFTVPNAAGTATFHGEASDAAGNTGTTPDRSVTLTGSGTMNPPMGMNPPPSTGGSKITIMIEMDTGADPSERVVIPRATITSDKGPIKSATIVWTDASGATYHFPLCQVATTQWSLPIQLARKTGQRSFYVQAVDMANGTGASPKNSFSVDD